MTNYDSYHLPDAFRIRYGNLDRQHEQLIAMINKCSVIVGDGILENFEAPFQRFIELLAHHFADEESAMREHGYPGLEVHQEHHRECLKRARDGLAESRSRGYVDRQSMNSCFSHIISDIAKADLLFGEFLDEKGLRPSHA